MKSKIVSMFLCIVIVTTISVAIIQNLGPLSMNASGAGGLADSPWPMIRQNLNHTGLSPYNTSANPGKLKWSFTTGHNVWSFPSIGSDGTIYVGSCDKKLYAINPDGTEKWNFTTGKSVDSSPAIGFDGTIYIGSDDHKLYAINPDGTEKWSFTTWNEVVSSPAIGSDGTIYVGSWDHKLYAINPDGTEKWNFTTGWSILSSPAIGSDGTIYVGSYDDKLYAINPDGTEKWNFITGDRVDSSPAIGSDGTIYVGSWDNKLYAINSDGTEKWNFTTGSRVHSSPAIGSDGTIYVGSVDNNLYAINPDGTEKWSFKTGHYVYQSSPAISSDGTIYIGSRDYNLYAINPDGTKKWNFTTGGYVDSSPAIGSDGTIYIGSSDNKLYAIGIPIKPPIADAGPDQVVNEGDVAQFNGSASYDPDGNITNYEWDFNASDGLWWETGAMPDAKGPTPNHTYDDSGVYIVTLKVTDNNGSSDTDTCEITVLLSPLEPPTLYLYVSLDGKDVILHWDPPLTPGIDHYLIYRSTSQTDFDFNILWKNTSIDKGLGEPTPMPLRTMWNDTNAAFPGNDTNYKEQYYYMVRAVNILGDVSSTSRTVGKWTKTFPQGISTFSLPLEPLQNITIDYCLYDMNAGYIKWMHPGLHTWKKHGDGGVNDTQMKVGEGYEVKFDSQITYTFTGMPSAMISYDDDSGFLGFDPVIEAKSLEVSVEQNGNVNLTWQEPGGIGPGDWYEVYYSNKRDGFFRTFDTDYFLVCPPVYFGNNTTTHINAQANNPGARLYYMVVPFNASGVRGSSTYSIGIWTEEYLLEHDTIGIPLKLSSNHTADWYCDNIPDTVGINYFIYSEQRWGWHSKRMPGGAYDPFLVMTEGYQISTSQATKFTFIGV